VPHDTESYIHRIGRTGRAGRSGQAIIFVAPREKRMLFSIERATKQQIEPMDLPSVADINRSRVERFKIQIAETIATENLDFFSQLITELQQEKELSSEQIAAATAFLAQGETSLVLDEKAMALDAKTTHASRGFDRDEREPRGRRKHRDSGRDDRPTPARHATPLKDHPGIEMQRFRLEVGRRNQVKPGNIVGAIANEAELESQYIGEIEIRDAYSTVDLPADMPKEVMTILKNTRVAGRPLGITLFDGEGNVENGAAAKPRKKSFNSKKTKEKSKQTKSDYAKRKSRERKSKRS